MPEIHREAEKCYNCGATNGLHQADTLQCPKDGREESNFAKPQQWEETKWDGGNGEIGLRLRLESSQQEVKRLSDSLTFEQTVCKMEKEKLQQEVAKQKRAIELKDAAIEKWLPCPDHRDKVNGGCYVCQNEKLQREVEKLKEEMNRMVFELSAAKAKLEETHVHAEILGRTAISIKDEWSQDAEQLRAAFAESKKREITLAEILRREDITTIINLSDGDRELYLSILAEKEQKGSGT